MAARADQDLILKIATLRRSAPREFDDAIVVLKHYSDEVSKLCVQSPPEHLQRLQGRAQQCAEFVSMFTDANKTADRVERVRSRRVGAAS